MLIVTISLQYFTYNPTPKFDPNAEESGKIRDFRSFNYNRYGLLLHMCYRRFLAERSLGEVFVLSKTAMASHRRLNTVLQC